MCSFYVSRTAGYAYVVKKLTILIPKHQTDG
jgi:hypothetical protein